MKQNTAIKRLLSLLLTATMLLGLVIIPNSIEASALSLQGSSSSLLNLDKQPPAGMANVTNPYGYDEDVAFAMSVSSEMLYFGGEDGDKHTHVFNGDSLNAVKTLVNAPNNGSGSYQIPDGTWNWVQAVAFDPSEDASRDNHVLFVGVKESDQCAYAWVLNYNNEDDPIVGPTKIGEMSWIGNSYEMYSSTTLIEVAAGDFDGDGVDTLLAYVPLNLNAKYGVGCSLFELKYDGSSLAVGSIGNHLLMDTYINDQAAKKYLDQADQGDDDRDKLAVSMQVADFNGDTVDDLAILSYSHNRSRGDSTAYYTPELNICYGGSSVTGISNLKAQATYDAASKTNDGKHVFPMGACLAAGDYNNDGYDDLYVTGVKTTFSNNSISEDENNWYLQSWYGQGSQSLMGGSYSTTASNEWFRGGFYTDDTCYSKVMSAGVAISGHAAAEMLFICGTLYDVSAGAPVKVAQQGYFDSKDQGLKAVTCTNTYVQSIAVGNFDNNAADREQVVFVLGLKERGHDDYWFMSGMISGSTFSDTKNADGTTAYGAATEYYCTDMDNDASYIHTNKGDDVDEGLACLLIRLDYDTDDGIMAKYRGANYMYTDPQVRAVLQAAPYFGDIATSASNATGYTLTTTYAEDDIDGHTTNFGLGLSFTGNGAFVHDATLDVGYKHTWNRTVTETYSTEYSDTFYAGAYDTVVVHRIPLIVYMYEIADKDGKFQDNGTVNMEFSMPQEPVWQQMSIPAYNKFVDEYNAMMEGAKDLEGNPVTFLGLNKINEAENWMADNEGNPYAYNHMGWANDSISAKQISNSSFALGTSGGYTSVTWNEGNSKNTEETHGCGFFVNASIHFGGKHWGVGPTANMDYTCNWGSATCTGSVTGVTCTVTDLDGPALLESGMDEDTLNQYAFTWTFGQWSRDLGMRDNKGNVVYTPFLGYNVTNMASPPRCATNLTAEANGADQIVLNWTEPTTPAGWPGVDGYVIYQTNGTEGAVKVAEVAAPADSYIVTSIANAALEPDTSYTFCVGSYHDASNGRVYGAVSNEASAVTALQKYQITTDCDTETVDLTIKKADGTTVSSGDMVAVGTELTVTATAKTEQYILHRLAIQPTNVLGAKIENFSSSDGGKTITATCTVTRDTSFVVYTAEVFEEMKVNYAANLYDADTLAGTVSAKTANSSGIGSGAWVSDPVIFTAAPETGYKLTGWQLEVDGLTLLYLATSDSLDFEMPLLAGEITVNAVFETVLEKLTVTVNQPAEGGTIKVTDDSGTTLTPQEDGTYKVLYNTPVTFTVVPDVGYILSSWTGAAAEQNSEQVTLNILSDTEVGAILRAPVKYSIYYTAVDENGNTVTTEPNIASGKPVAAGTPVTFTAQAAEGYRISGWTVTRGGVETDHYAKQQHVSSGSATEIVQNETKVDVTFVPENTYAVRIQQAGEGTVTMTCNGQPITSGDSVAYLSDVTVTAQAAENWQMTNIAGWIDNGDGSYSLTLEDVEADQTVDVVFGTLYRTVTVKQPALGGMIVLRDAAGKDMELDADGTCQVLIGTELVAHIELDDGYAFGGWAEDAASLTGTRISLTVAGDTVIGAKVESVTAGDPDDSTPNDKEPEEGCVCENYTDLQEDDWYHDACVFVIENGLMTGTKENVFEPENGLSRAMIVRILYNLDGKPAVTVKDHFTDVESGRWYTAAISWGVENGIINGIGGGKFAPDDLVTREQMVAMLYRYAQYKGMDVSAQTDLSGYADVADVHNYARTAMAWAVAEGVVKGVTDDTLIPAKTATRAEAATVMMRFVKII